LVYTALIELINFKSWTESLGYDREWLIQITQSEIYSLIQSITKDFGGYSLPLRYDVQISILPLNADINLFTDDLRSALMSKSPVPISINVRCGLPHEVLSNEFRAECHPRDICIAHLDLNDFTLKSSHRGLYHPYVDVLRITSELAIKLVGRAIVQYLGGDNVAVISDPKYLDSIVNEIMKYDVKLGIGISKYPRKSFELATKALSILRKGNRSLKYLVLRE